MSFLDKLKVKVEENKGVEEVTTQDKKDKRFAGFLQLDVDIFQTGTDIIIVAPIPGIDINDLDISIENENDVVTIQGRRNVPQLEGMEPGIEPKVLRQECQWGQFYRQIILPQEVNVAEVQAKFKKGILFLRLPLLRLQTGGKKKVMVQN